MPMYRVITPLRNGGPEPVPQGDPVELDAAEGEQLAAIGAVEPAPELEVAPLPLPVEIGGVVVTDAPAAGAGEALQLPGGVDAAGQPLPPVAVAPKPARRRRAKVEAGNG